MGKKRKCSEYIDPMQCKMNKCVFSEGVCQMRQRKKAKAAPKGSGGDVKMEYKAIPSKVDVLTGEVTPAQQILEIKSTKKKEPIKKREKCELYDDKKECKGDGGCMFKDGKCVNKSWAAENCPLMTIADSKKWFEKLKKWETEMILAETCENLDYKACGEKSECKWSGWTRWTGKCIPKVTLTEFAEIDKQIMDLPCIIKNLRMKEDLNKEETRTLDQAVKMMNELTKEIKKYAGELKDLIKMDNQKKDLEEQMKKATSPNTLHLLEHEHAEIVIKMKEQQTSWFGLIKKVVKYVGFKKWAAIGAAALGFAISQGWGIDYLDRFIEWGGKSSSWVIWTATRFLGIMRVFLHWEKEWGKTEWDEMSPKERKAKHEEIIEAAKQRNEVLRKNFSFFSTPTNLPPLKMSSRK